MNAAAIMLEAPATPLPPAGADPLGTILVELGRLSPEDCSRITQAQREQGLDFDEAGLRLGLLTQDDIEQARARQFGYPYLFEGDGELSTELAAAYRPFSAEAERLRVLRTELKLRWFTGMPGRRLLAVVGAGHGDGRSVLTANLAIAFSQLGERTLLIDADLRRPRQHALFNLVNHIGLSLVLAQAGTPAMAARDGQRGRRSEVPRDPPRDLPPEVAHDLRHAPQRPPQQDLLHDPQAVLRAASRAVQTVAALPDLAVLTAGPVPPNPQELLGRPGFGRLLEHVAREFDVVLIDTPAATDYADALTVAARAGGALLVVRRDCTPLARVRRLVADLDHHGVTLAGSVLADF